MSRHFDLSRNKSLRTLETSAESIARAQDTASRFFETVLSTTMPSLPLDVVIAYSGGDNGFVAWDTERIARMGWGSPYVSPETNVAMCHSERFKVLRGMHEVRKFRLVFCAETRGDDVERVVKMLERIVEGEKARGGFDYLECEPSIILR